jgi:hypothetical protein
MRGRVREGERDMRDRYTDRDRGKTDAESISEDIPSKRVISDIGESDT